MATGHLSIVAPAGELEALLQKFAEGAVDIALVSVDVSADGELLRHHLRPFSVTGLSVLASTEDLPDERIGTLVRVYATRPDEEE